ncbi:MAG: hypothetical protein ABFS45_06385 [Pseudomonadota bacterium]
MRAYPLLQSTLALFLAISGGAVAIVNAQDVHSSAKQIAVLDRTALPSGKATIGY